MFLETASEEKPGQDSLSHFYLPTGLRLDLTDPLPLKRHRGRQGRPATGPASCYYLGSLE